MRKMAKYALLIEYDGTHFRGWQKQANPPIRSIEGALEKAIGFVANHPVTIIGAGRTDAGVHALNQVAHFESPSQRSFYAWTMGINSNLPDDITVKAISEVPISFHARFSAKSRTYVYYIYNSPTRSALKRHHYTWIYYSLDKEAMVESAQYLIGEHDFSAFRSSECQSKSTHRCIESIIIETPEPAIVKISITANAFLHFMVRNIVGNLLKIGRGLAPPSYMEKVLLSQDRTEGAATAPPQGLYLIKVNYNESIF